MSDTTDYLTALAEFLESATFVYPNGATCGAAKIVRAARDELVRLRKQIFRIDPEDFECEHGVPLVEECPLCDDEYAASLEGK